MLTKHELTHLSVSHGFSSIYLNVQDSPTPAFNVATATVDSKEGLRASAPAGPTSALDKAMSFLNKYKLGASGSAKAEGMGSSRRPANVAKSSDEDEMDISLSSDSDAAARNPARKSPSRLKAKRENLVLQPQTGKATTTERNFPSRSVTLTEMRSSAHFATAKELGISESGGLDGPKAAVSPVGFQNNRTNEIGGGSLYQANVSPPEQQSSSLHLAVNIPGESSTYGSLVRHGSGSDVESVGSAVTEALEEQIRGKGETSEGEPWRGHLNSEPSRSSEVDAGGSSSLVSPTRTLEQQQHGSVSGGRFAQSPHDYRSALGKITSLDDLPTGSPPRFSSIPGAREGSAVGGGDNCERSVASSHENHHTEGSEAEGEEDEEEDDYGDDDFEDLDGLTESNGEKPGGQGVVSETPVVAGAQGTKLASIARETAEVSQADENQSCVGQAKSSAGLAVLGQPREAWSASSSSQDQTRPMPTTSESGTSPEPRVNWDNDRVDRGAPENDGSLDGRAPSGTKEAWGQTSARGSCTRDDGDTTSARTERMKGDASQPFIPKSGQFQYQSTSSNAACETTREGVSEGSVSKGGVLIDRSTEARDPIRPPDTKVKVITRSEAVASFEYTHDQERGLHLRSCGTQVMYR